MARSAAATKADRKGVRLRVREALLLDRWARQREEPLRLAMGWSEMLAYDHVRRLVGAGLVRRVPMTRGRWVADHRHAGRRDDCRLSGEQGTALGWPADVGADVRARMGQRVA